MATTVFVTPAWRLDERRVWSSARVSATLTMLVAALLPTESRAQGFQPHEQFFTLSMGPGRTSITPEGFVWVDEEFPEGLVLPARQGGGAIEMSLGVMAGGRVAILGGFEMLLGGEDLPRVANYHLFGGARSWLTKRIWVEGGLGPTWTDVFAGEGVEQRDSVRAGFGVVAVAGYDLIQRRNPSFFIGHFVAHVQARIASNAAGGVRANTVALLFGFAGGW
jgi:hypothetical protein